MAHVTQIDSTRLSDLHYAIARIESSATLQQWSDTMAQEACALFGAEECHVLEYSYDEDIFRAISTYPSTLSIEGFELELGEGQLGYIAQFDIPAQFENDYAQSQYISRGLTDYRDALSCLIKQPGTNKLLGGITLANTKGGRGWHDDDVVLAQAFCDSIALGLRISELYEDNLRLREELEAMRQKTSELIASKESILYDKMRELKTLASRSSNMVEMERTRISQQLHDSVKQEIAGTMHVLEAALKLLPENAEDSKDRLSMALDFLQQANRDIQNIVISLRPQELDDRGLAICAERYAQRFSETTGITCNVSIYGVHDLPRDVEEALYYMLTEALQNVFVHSGATHASVNLNQTLSAVRMTVKDDGRGFDTNQPMYSTDRGLGLPGMRTRIEAAGGEFSVFSRVQQGTSISARIPLSIKHNPIKE